MALSTRRSRRPSIDIWPGFVDALAQLLMVIIFVLLVFTAGQFLLSDALSGRDKALQQLQLQLNELTDLLTGAGHGVMEAVSRAFHETSPRAGIVIGVVPAAIEPFEAIEQRTALRVEYDVPIGYPNEWVELAIYTHLPDSGSEGTLRSSRNHINVLSADAIVALPGSEGTESEIWLATRYGVPIVAYGTHRDNAAQGIARAASIDEVRDFLVRHVRASSPPTT